LIDTSIILMSYSSGLNRKTDQPVCPHCRGKDVSFAVASVGVVKCNDCGHSKAVLSLRTSRPASDDIIGSLVALGAIALGAVVIGAFVESLSGPPKRRAPVVYDEENWQKLFK
jgi:ribosomal protein L37AE/L43A